MFVHLRVSSSEPHRRTATPVSPPSRLRWSSVGAGATSAAVTFFAFTAACGSIATFAPSPADDGGAPWRAESRRRLGARRIGDLISTVEPAGPQPSPIAAPRLSPRVYGGRKLGPRLAWRWWWPGRADPDQRRSRTSSPLAAINGGFADGGSWHAHQHHAEGMQ